VPLSRRRSKHRHRAAHGTEHPVHPVPAWTDDEQWFEPDDAHPGWAEPRHHEPAPWRSEEPGWDDERLPRYPPAQDYPPRPDYPPAQSYAPRPDYPPAQNYAPPEEYPTGREFAPPDDYAPAHSYPRFPPDGPPPDHLTQQEYPADDYDEGYEQHGPDETPALRGRLIRLPRRRAELPEAVRDCLHWGIFALVLVPVFLVATGGSVLNAIVVMISILILGVVVIWVVRLGKIALPNLEPVHQLEPLEPEAHDPIEAEWQEAPEPAGPDDGWPELAGPGREWPEPPGSGREWPERTGPGREWPEPVWEPLVPPQPAAGEPQRQPSAPAWPSDLNWRPEGPAPGAAPNEREHVGRPPTDQ